MMQQSLAIGAALAQKYGALLRERLFWMCSSLGLLGSNSWEMGKICEIAHNYEDQIQAMAKENIQKLLFFKGDPNELVGWN